MPSSRHDVAARSPWLAQLPADVAAAPLTADVDTDVVIVGAGIAGVATAFFTLRNTDHRVVLIERDRVARGATGHNAGQLTTYFERPLHDIAEEYGEEMAIEAQRVFDGANDLLDVIAAETDAPVRVERFLGHMGMFSLNHLEVHLRINEMRRRGGLRIAQCIVSEDAEFLDDVPPELAGLYTVVPQRTICEVLGTDDDRFRAVLSEPKGCANSAALVHQVLHHLLERHPARFTYADHTHVERIVLDDDRAVVHAGGRRVDTRRVVLCTNGFADHVVEHRDGTVLHHVADQDVFGTIGYMAGFLEEQLRQPAATSYIRNAQIGGDTPYVYVTRRTYDAGGVSHTLTCMGGPERELADGEHYDLATPFPRAVLDEMDAVIRPYAQPSRPAGSPVDFAWHGLMGYTPGRIRLIGAEPSNPVLLYNLGCNGVGFLPSIAGGERISRLLRGDVLAPSVFDPR